MKFTTGNKLETFFLKISLVGLGLGHQTFPRIPVEVPRPKFGQKASTTKEAPQIVKMASTGRRGEISITVTKTGLLRHQLRTTKKAIAINLPSSRTTGWDNSRNTL